MNIAIQSIRDAFLRAFDNNYEFPTAVRHKMFSKIEEDLIRIVAERKAGGLEVVAELEDGISNADSYSIVILGLRVIVHAVRIGSQDMFATGIPFLLAGCPHIDERDVLKGLCVAEECARKLELDLRAMLDDELIHSPNEEFSSLMNEYFERTDAKRQLDSMLLVQVSDGENLQFKHRWSDGFDLPT